MGRKGLCAAEERGDLSCVVFLVHAYWESPGLKSWLVQKMAWCWGDCLLALLIFQSRVLIPSLPGECIKHITTIYGPLHLPFPFSIAAPCTPYRC